jgi:hypothetical protein
MSYDASNSGFCLLDVWFVALLVCYLTNIARLAQRSTRHIPAAICEEDLLCFQHMRLFLLVKEKESSCIAFKSEAGDSSSRPLPGTWACAASGLACRVECSMPPCKA